MIREWSPKNGALLNEIDSTKRDTYLLPRKGARKSLRPEESSYQTFLTF